MGREGEPWHVGGSGGYLRSIVYGFNDGLTANFGLVAGVLGADVAPHIVIISGVAGALADALSMGSSGYLAAKSEAEVHAHQIEIERQEMTLMPDLEEEELAIIYESKGLTPQRARETAPAMMQDPPQALDTMVREELNIHPAELAPLRTASSPARPRRLARSSRSCRSSCLPTRERSGRRWWSAWPRTSRSAPRAASSPAAASGAAAATCSSSASASRRSAT